MGIFDNFLKPNVKKMKAKKDINGLIKALNYEKDPQVQKDAALALGEVGDVRAVKPLIQAIIQSLEYSFYVDEVDNKMLLRNKVKTALDEIDWQPDDDFERAYYLIAKEKWDELVKIGEPAIEPLIQASNHYFVRSEAIKAIKTIGETTIEPLIEALKDESPPHAVITVIGEIGDERAVEPLIQSLKDTFFIVREEAAEALGKIGDERAVEPLIQALKDEENGVRKNAAEALRKMGWQPKDDFEKVYYLIAQLESDKLAKIGEPAVEPLIQALKNDRYHAVREYAARALGKIGDKRAVKPLIQVVKKDDNEFVRSTASKALEKIGD